MSSQQCKHCFSSSSILFCPSESIFFCKGCSDKHLSSLNGHNCLANYLCEECEQKHAECFCIGCDQNLCDDCSLNLHKKGARAQHVRNKLDLPKYNNEQNEKSMCLVLLNKNFLESKKGFLMKLFANEEVFYIFIFENQEEEAAIKNIFAEMNGKEENKIQYCSYMTNNEKSLYQFLEADDRLNEKKTNIKKIVLMDEITKILDVKIVEELFLNKEKSFLKQAQIFIIFKDALKDVKKIEDFKLVENSQKPENIENGKIISYFHF